MNPSANSPTKLLLILSGIFLLFILGSAGYYFYLSKPSSQDTKVEGPRNFDLALSLAPKPQGLPGLDPLTNIIQGQKLETAATQLAGLGAGFFSSSYVTVIFTGKVSEIISTTKEFDGIDHPLGIKITNENGNELSIYFNREELEKMRAFLSKSAGDTAQVDTIAYSEIFPGDQVLITISINLLDPQDVNDVGIEVKRD